MFFVVLLAGFFSQQGFAQGVIWSLHNVTFTQCVNVPEGSEVPDFSQPNCNETSFYSIDPQNTMLWVKASIPNKFLEQSTAEPLAAYVMGKASARIFLNGELIGESGQPSATAEKERVGTMDKAYYLPKVLLKESNNLLVLQLSSHNGFITLEHPMHFVGIGPYGDSKRFVQQYISLGLILLGVFVLSAFYYGNLWIRLGHKKDVKLLFLMSIFASAQLIAELSRGLFDYTYPFQDIRLIAISVLSLGIGLCLLALVSQKYAHHYKLHWVYGGALVTISTLFMVASFDAKTTLAIILPTLLSIVVVGVNLKRAFRWRTVRFLVVMLGFLSIMVITFRYFHEIMFYVLLGALLMFLFAQHAREYSKEQDELEEEKALRAKLEFKLAQSKQQSTNQTLNIESAGKVEKVSVQDILFCQAAGDYVEITTSSRQHLYSGSLKKVLENLPSTFLRVHRSYAVNLDKVIALKREADSGFLVLTDNNQIPVSRRMLPSVKESLSAY